MQRVPITGTSIGFHRSRQTRRQTNPLTRRRVTARTRLAFRSGRTVSGGVGGDLAPADRSEQSPEAVLPAATRVGRRPANAISCSERDVADMERRNTGSHRRLFPLDPGRATSDSGHGARLAPDRHLPSANSGRRRRRSSNPRGARRTGPSTLSQGPSVVQQRLRQRQPDSTKAGEVPKRRGATAHRESSGPAGLPVLVHGGSRG
jgi:hypothetical protein